MDRRIAVLLCLLASFILAPFPRASAQTIQCTAIWGDSTALLSVPDLKNCPIANWGRAGSTSSLWLSPYGTSPTYVDFINTYNSSRKLPISTVVLMIGRNDITQKIPTATTVANISVMYAKAKASGYHFILTTVVPNQKAPNLALTATYTATRDKTIALNAAILQFAQDNGIPIVDLYSVLAGADGFAIPENMSDDIHQSGLGSYRIVQSLLPAIQYVQNNSDTFILFGKATQ
ncbi:MAG TPA: SGNH/GDSL hydrolase family protein [Terriglobales bacterium]|nr:SGNH/GDSL hydrolase family protein [Terriglobales bacterium]